MKCSETLNDYGGRRQKKRFCIYLKEDCLLIGQKEEQTKHQKSGKKLYKKIEGETNRAKVLKRRILYKNWTGCGDEDALGGKSALKLFMLQAQRLDRATVEMSPPFDRSPFFYLLRWIDLSMNDCYSLLITLSSQNTLSHRWNLMYLTLVLHGVGIFYNNHTHLCFVVVF